MTKTNSAVFRECFRVDTHYNYGNCLTSADHSFGNFEFWSLGFVWILVLGAWNLLTLIHGQPYQ